MGQIVVFIQVLVLYSHLVFPNLAFAQHKQNYYANICPNVETIVQTTVSAKVKLQPNTIPGTLRLFFHDCFVQGCDALIMMQSSGSNMAEKDHQDNLNKVSCADILTMATRDVIKMAGGPSYPVELGRLDGISSTAASVNGKLPKPKQNLDQLNAMFAANGLTQVDMIALSATVSKRRRPAGNYTYGSQHTNNL
nr:peroxidase 51-like [Tanacetum cinerariifolium]